MLSQSLISTPVPIQPAGDHPVQPLLHDSTIVLAAPTQAWSRPDGRTELPIHGLYHADTRVLSGWDVSVGGAHGEAIAQAGRGSGEVTFTSLLRHLDDATADPRLRLEVTRTVSAGRMRERITIRSGLGHTVSTTIALRVHPDFSDMQTVKAGLADPKSRRAFPTEDLPETPVVDLETLADGIRLSTPSVTAVLRFGSDATLAQTPASAAGGAHRAGTDAAAPVVAASWAVEVPAHGTATVEWTVDVEHRATVVQAAEGLPEWDGVTVHSGDARLGRWVQRALDDLSGLRMATTARPDDPFLAAGAPWFFTLFGRDSLWAARFLLPLGTDIAGSTLRLLASLQGTVSDPETAEQPGKIMHELRPGAFSMPGESLNLPPLYYGTVDATPLWICLLNDAWHWGLPDAEVVALLPHLEAALGWMRDSGDSHDDGFLSYVDETGHGLANQGWKDSGDSIQWRDGSLAEGPIALCEVQAYAYQAAIGGAELLEAFGRPGAAEWRTWAANLRARFRASFWIDSPEGRYPAVALDAHKRPVDTVTSNIGHLLGTGLLNDEESALVAARLVSTELNSGFGLRTMSTDSTGYWPLSYHGGSVWTHDTAIAINGLGRAGFGAEAGILIDGLLAAAESFGYRMPELHSGDSAAEFPVAVPYPAACRPQAWSAAAAISVLGTVLGLAPDREAGTVASTPITPALLGSVTILPRQPRA
ncbi:MULTISPECIES: glycogen debranching N-terminal domain-containing protein [unclassified Cryobacterium]|uniref:glycogen debranching N-terminal domain-containing protein n=1 Tax=unclassified Cryobacterium TaxID=2649013 RepID=UPI002AB477BA|nr:MULTISPECIES: glycogen debranching N-terminal domain-containing protein [unclassified Cryobacterium]MDY7528736.1 glycogen debranching N-terminal domain-containing protein [Cryobacterium sp. 10C2]MDY7555520.1 glycogen debranching N-terminal domain-containing protein [Cryobacterium sp. 10C3]MEB0289818.1 glycogen debranching N-terminal domain-containing protein [Cryobacterium sp. 10C2]